MKSKKVLLGLIVTAFVGLAGFSTAQTKANYQNNLIEIGPDNVGGRTRAIIVDQRDTTGKSLYAAGVAGGLFHMPNGATSWEYVPCYLNGKEVTLPISYMVQTPDNMVCIATGEGMAVGKYANAAFLVPEGRGMYRFNPEDKSFTLVSGTANWKYINRMDYLYRDGKLYFYVATNTGLYRWTINQASDWNNAPETVFADGAVQDIEIVSGDNMAFFTSGSHIYKISNVVNPATSNKYTDISATNPAFGGDGIRIEMAAAKSDKTYLYAMVTNANGMLDGVYLTNNQQSWTKLTTSTIVPFTSKNNGYHNSTITIDPVNHKHIFIAGATIWEGRGYVEGSNYLWNKVSLSEDELNFGNYMEQVYMDFQFVHSGVHEILPVKQDDDWVFFIATDGGVYKTANYFQSFVSVNSGLNTAQFNGIAVAPDASVLGGAIDNSCPFIQSRHAHYNAETNQTWYDSTSTMNHRASILWFGDGGQVEASMFQQVLPLSRRGLFFSSCGSDFQIASGVGVQPVINYGRAYADYTDYTNTQTWTIAEAFVEDGISYSLTIPQMTLWETLDNQANDSVTFNIDVLGTIVRGNDTLPLSDTFAIKTGDKYTVGSRAHMGYPFTYTFDHNFVVNQEPQHKVHNPIANRMFISGKKTSQDGPGVSVVRMTTTPTDYSKVWTIDDAGAASTMHWYDIFKTTKISGEHTGFLAVTNNGDACFVNVYDTADNHYILRVSNLNDARIYYGNYSKCNEYLDFAATTKITNLDTVVFSGSDYRFARPITSMYVDPRSNKDVLLVTFGGETDANTPNVWVVNNANDTLLRTVKQFTVAGGRPIYSGLIECTTGMIYLGTDNGVYTIADGANTVSSETYGAFDGVPVTSIRQQTKALPRCAYTSHTGINEEKYLFAKTKYPYALYFGTYGRGIFVDMQYVKDTVNEIVDPSDFAGITNVTVGDNKISVYPNPASTVANINMTVANTSNAVVKIYDMSGKLVYNDYIGTVEEGSHIYQLDCQNFRHGMYLVNVTFGRQTATSKLIVR